MKGTQHVLETSDIYRKFQELLNEMFQMNNADLDFGLYRIMNARRKEINRFLNEELLSQVDKVFEECIQVDKKRLEEELQEAIQKAKELGLENPEEVPQVKKIREQLKHAIDVTTAKIDVFSHLTTFFSRYYQDGDFVSLRRYKWDKHTYAIPYNGEEVKLYWANYDQYYIKTSEYFREYSFFVEFPNGKRGKVYFKVKEADYEKDNIKGKERFFIFKELEVKDRELFVYFNYKPVEEKKKNMQQELNRESVEKILNSEKLTKDWKFALSKEKKVKKSNDKKTILEKHINKYTAKNKFDFFIHKDLGGFLKRELDFYIKNEVVDLYEFQNLPPDKVKEYICKVKAIKLIGEKIIDFLAQLENFQKKLWLKKKFIWETQYCITLDRIFAISDEEKRNWLIERILENQDQIEEWKKLYHVHEIKGDLIRPGWSEPPTIEFLEAHPHLVVDTRHFDEDFKLKLISSFDNLDEELDGLLVHGENFQALNLLLERYRGQVKCIYIDPPYNTGNDEFIYKDNYQHSSWLTMMENRLKLAKELMREDAAIFISIDDHQEYTLHNLLIKTFGSENVLPTVVVRRRKSQPNLRKGVAPVHDYLKISAKNLDQLDRFSFIPEEFGIGKFSNPDNDPRGPWTTAPCSNRGGSRYKIVTPAGIEYEDEWRFTKETYLRLLKEGRIYFPNSGKGKPRYKIYLSEKKEQGVTPSTWWDDVGDTQTSHKLLEEAFGTRIFENPKPIELLRKVIDISTSPYERNFILDYFTGSGTTAHAVINLNREDGGRRKYILVEVADYFDTALLPRIKKVVFSRDWKDGKPKPDEKGNLNGISHFFKYIRLESYEDTLN